MLKYNVYLQMGVMIGIIRDLEKLLNREGLKQNLSGTSDLSRILSEEEIWELILSSGYLTIQEKIDEDNYILRLSNKEVRRLFRKTFFERYFGRGSKLMNLMDALIENIGSFPLIFKLKFRM